MREFGPLGNLIFGCSFEVFINVASLLKNKFESSLLSLTTSLKKAQVMIEAAGGLIKMTSQYFCFGIVQSTSVRSKDVTQF